MIKICLDPGHGATDPGAILGKRYEKDDVLRLALAVKTLLQAQGIEVIMTRTADTGVNINQRCKLANDANCNYFLSLHRDAAGATAYGISTWVHSQASATTVSKAQKLMDAVLAVTPTYNRKVCKGTPQSYADFGINAGTNMESALLELGFITNTADNARFDEHFNAYAEAITRGLCGIVGKSYITPIDKSTYTKISGTAQATAGQMRAYLAARNPTAPDYAALYIAEGAVENIRGDIAFAQSCIETDYWRFGGDVKPGQNNFSGLGATGGGAAGNSFSTPREGIRAQIQHLKAYACTDPLNGVCVDPRFCYVVRDVAPYVEWLGIPDNPHGKGWAAGKGYGAAILKVLSEILATDTTETPAAPSSPETISYTKEQVQALRAHIQAIQDILGKRVDG